MALDPPTVRRALRRARRAIAPRRLGLAGRGRRRAVLIASGPGGDARIYRGDHRVEQLRTADITADVCYRNDVDLVRLVHRYRCIVLYRVEWDDDVASLIATASAVGCSVVCDFDDLVFDPARAQLLRGLDALEATARTHFVESITRQRMTLDACNATTASTDPLAREAAAVGARAATVPNVVGLEMVQRADVARAAARRDPNVVRVGYLSGTPTHEADFAEVADALLWALGRYPEVEVVIAGFLELDERFGSFGERVVRELYRPRNELPALIAALDVNLAPLEPGNPFTDCKSCLKYLEAGVVGVPTIASARPDFARVIRDGENGLLADSVGEWRNALGQLIERTELRQRLGSAARTDVITHHTTRATAEAAASALERLVPNLR